MAIGYHHSYNVYEISVCARGKFQSKTNVFHGFSTVVYSIVSGFTDNRSRISVTGSPLAR